MNPNISRVMQGGGIPDAPSTGGNEIDTVNDNVYHVFTEDGTFTAGSNLTANVLLVAGGGTGREGSSITRGGGGGGGGGLIEWQEVTFVKGQSYAITVGEGGIAATDTDAEDSTCEHSAGTLTAVKGGIGGTGQSSGVDGADGGSGGGGGNNNSTAGRAGGTGSQGNDGGDATTDSNGGAGGGGGFSSAGQDGQGVTSASVGGYGGEGWTIDADTKTLTSFSGMTKLSSGGGGGARTNDAEPGTGGAAGTDAGSGSGGTEAAPTAGSSPVSYGCGSGGFTTNVTGKDGFKGVAVIRYAAA